MRFSDCQNQRISHHRIQKHRLDYFFKAGLSEGLGGGGGFALGLDRVPDSRLKVAELSSSSSWIGVGGRGLSLWALLNIRNHKIRKFDHAPYPFVHSYLSSVFIIQLLYHRVSGPLWYRRRWYFGSIGLVERRIPEIDHKSQVTSNIKYLEKGPDPEESLW